MNIQCPNCGCDIVVKGSGGRKPSTVSLVSVCDALKSYPTVREAAKALGCSRALLYKVLKTGKMTVAGAIG